MPCWAQIAAPSLSHRSIPSRFCSGIYSLCLPTVHLTVYHHYRSEIESQVGAEITSKIPNPSHFVPEFSSGSSFEWCPSCWMDWSFLLTGTSPGYCIHIAQPLVLSLSFSMFILSQLFSEEYCLWENKSSSQQNHNQQNRRESWTKLAWLGIRTSLRSYSMVTGCNTVGGSIVSLS